MAYNLPRSQIIVQGPVVDLTIVGNHNIFSTKGIFIVVAVTLNAVNLTGNIGLPGLSLGFTSPNYNDIINQSFGYSTSNSGNYQYSTVQSISNALPVPASTTLVLRVAVNDSTATTNTQSIYIHGFYM